MDIQVYLGTCFTYMHMPREYEITYLLGNSVFFFLLRPKNNLNFFPESKQNESCKKKDTQQENKVEEPRKSVLF